MEELEKTCENCKYEHEDIEGTHCRHCIHNAEERFEPKVIVPTEAEIRAKAIDETCLKIFNHLLSEIEWNRVLVDDWDALAEEFKEVAEQLKAGGKNE